MEAKGGFTMHRLAFLSPLLPFAMAGCTNTEAPRDLALRTTHRIHVGESIHRVESVLKGAGFEFSYNKQANEIYAITRRPKRYGFVLEDYQLVVTFDSARRVHGVKMHQLLTGP
jgi:hypothetical protein